MGNSTRCHAVIQRLTDLGVDCDVITSGNGLKYFSKRAEVDTLQSIEELYYGSKNGQISIFRTLASLAAYGRILNNNQRRITGFLSERRPDLVVTDSIYTRKPMQQLGIPIIAINNSDAVCRDYWKYPDRPWSIAPQFLAVEQLDCLYHRSFPDLVLSTALVPEVPAKRGRFLSIGPLVRKDYSPRPFRQNVEKALIMLSGSVFGSPVQLSKTAYSYHIDVVGRSGPDDVAGDTSVTYHGKLMDNRELVEDADIAVINGGFSAVSEMFYLRKPMVVVPVPRHSEQWVNARRIVELGVGLMAEEENFEEVMFDLIENYEAYRAGYERIPEMNVGASEAARAIVSFFEELHS